MARGDWPWFRLYSEARTDAKLRALSDAQHRVWFNLLCYAGEQGERGVIDARDDFLLAVECAGGDESLLRETIAILQRLCIVAEDLDARTLRFLAWDERQYDKPSDRPEATAERKRRSRQKAPSPASGHAGPANEEPVSRDVTPRHAIDTETETDPERDGGEVSPLPPTGVAPAALAKPTYSPLFEQFWREWSTGVTTGHGGKAPASAVWKRLKLDAAGAAATREELAAGLARWKASAYWQQEGGRFVMAAERWLKEHKWGDDPPEVFGPPRASPPATGARPGSRGENPHRFMNAEIVRTIQESW